MTLSLRTDNRIALFGRTGSGKTTLVKHLLSHFPRWVVLDAKHTYKAKGVKVVKQFDKRLDQQIIRVPPVGGRGEEALWSAAIESVWQRGDAVLYVDETTLITKPRVLLPALGKAIRTGRERGVGVWCASQRPKDLPSAIFTECEHIFCFQLQFSADRDKVVSFTADDLGRYLERVKWHEFVHFDVMRNGLTLYKNGGSHVV